MADTNGNAVTLGALETRVLAVEKDLERNSSQHKEFYDLFKKIAVEDGIQKSKIDQMCTMLQDVKVDVKSIKDKPARRFETIMNTVVQWATLGVLGLLVSQFGK